MYKVDDFFLSIYILFDELKILILLQIIFHVDLRKVFAMPSVIVMNSSNWAF